MAVLNELSSTALSKLVLTVFLQDPKAEQAEHRIMPRFFLKKKRKMNE